jgi:hypothetical protein
MAVVDECQFEYSSPRWETEGGRGRWRPVEVRRVNCERDERAPARIDREWERSPPDCHGRAGLGVQEGSAKGLPAT